MECNYDIGKRELLAAKAALEKYRHWFKGTYQPFVVYTDHRILKYIRQVKHLNPCQARWVLFCPRALVMVPDMWNLDSEIARVMCGRAAPRSFPPGTTFVPASGGVGPYHTGNRPPWHRAHLGSHPIKGKWLPTSPGRFNRVLFEKFRKAPTSCLPVNYSLFQYHPDHGPTSLSTLSRICLYRKVTPQSSWLWIII